MLVKLTNPKKSIIVVNPDDISRIIDAAVGGFSKIIFKDGGEVIVCGYPKDIYEDIMNELKEDVEVRR